jgi:hypothetical protein
LRGPLKVGEGRCFRGNLHCHSSRSDGVLEPEDVAAAYREAGYDFILTGSGDRWLGGMSRARGGGLRSEPAPRLLPPRERGRYGGKEGPEQPDMAPKLNFREFPLCEVRAQLLPFTALLHRLKELLARLDQSLRPLRLSGIIWST